MRLLLSILILAASLAAQTTINGGHTILGPWDASGASTTKPVKTGTSAPATCAVGELFYDTDATAGSNLFGCTATNTWTLLGGSYTLPTAAAGTLGGVRVGTGLSIDGSGILSTTVSGYDVFDTTTYQWKEDFASGANPANGAHVGAENLAFALLASATVVSGAGDENHPNLLAITSHATNADSAGIVRQAPFTSTTPTSMDITAFRNREWDYRGIFKLGSTSNARVRFGVGDNWAGASSNHFMGLRYDTNSSYTDDVKNTTGSWVAQICTTASGTCGDTGGEYVVMNVTPDTNYHTFRIWRSGTTVSMSIDATVVTFCASGCDTTVAKLASMTSGAPCLTLGFEAGGSITHSLDWMAFRMTGLTRP